MMKSRKKLIMSILFAGIAGTNAQNTNVFPNNGNVGIGTIIPWSTLQVNNPNLATGTFLNISGTAPGVLFNTNSNQNTLVPAIGLSTDNGHYLNSAIPGQLNIRGGVSGDVVFGSSRADGSFPELMRLKTTGNLGIGTINPIQKLDVNGNIRFSNTLTTDGRMHISGGEKLFLLNKDGVAISRAWGGNGNLEVDNNIYVGSTIHGVSRLHISGEEKLFLLNKEGVVVGKEWGGNGNLMVQGNVGIGTNNPDQKLTVKGKIHAEEVIVDLQVPADYVFEKYYNGNSTLNPNYKMPTLAEVEQFTKENNHLPNIPSAKEIQEKGLQVGEITNLLLQKMEEMTLYMIQLNKENQTLKKEIEQLKKSK